MSGRVDDVKVLTAAEVAEAVEWAGRIVTVKGKGRPDSARLMARVLIALHRQYAALLAWAETVPHEAGCASNVADLNEDEAAEWDVLHAFYPDADGLTDYGKERTAVLAAKVADTNNRKPCDCVISRVPR